MRKASKPNPMSIESRTLAPKAGSHRRSKVAVQSRWGLVSEFTASASTWAR